MARPTASPCAASRPTTRASSWRSCTSSSRDGADAAIINPGAWTHYSYALHDALELVTAPVAEVHLSDIENREEWRRVSVIADVVDVRVCGKGAAGYLDALEALAKLAAGRTQS